jgi:outer membrane protein OmpA-like peptidoglycan-associated protein
LHNEIEGAAARVAHEGKLAMIGNRGDKTGISRRVPWGGLASTLVVAGLVAGCTWMPDAVNPAEWYKSGRDAVTGEGPSDEKKKALEEAKPLPGEGESFPKLSSVSDAPSVPTAAEREKLAGSLVADREHARYTDDVVRGRVVAKAAPKQVAKAAPKQVPKAAPKAVVNPVMSRPVAALPPPRPFASAAPAPAPVMAAPPPPPARTARSDKKLPPLVFGPAPTDIAIAQKSVSPARFQAPGSLATDASRTLRAPAFRRQAAAHAGQVAVVHFAIGSTRLGPSARRTLRKVARMQREWRGAVRVVGHASSRTVDMDLVKHNLVNFQVSLDRAQSVARELMRLGVEPRVLRIGASSDSDPVFFEVMPAGETGNRRVEIYFEGRG